MRRIVTTIAALACIANGVSAQGPRGADTLSAASVADSMKVLQALDAQLHKQPNDAAMWYHRAMVTWALSDRMNARNPPAGPNAESMGRMTDSSLHLAMQLAPEKALYHLMMGRFYLTRGNITIRILASGQFNNALARARKGSDSLVLSEALVEVGRTNWRKYDSFKNRRMQTSDFDMARSIADAVQPTAKALGAMIANLPPEQAGMFDGTNQGALKAVEAMLKSSTMPLAGDINGAAEYERASQLFREAYDVAPTNGHAFRSLAMLLADSSRWIELETLSRAQLRKIPWDPNAWWTLGLARHRRGDSKSAAIAFDSATVYADPVERAHLDRIERILNPNDSARIAHASAAAHDATTRVYWMFADPLWSRDGNETRVEFLARVVFADLRWTVEELGLRGVDTDRGDVYIRYGPPDIAAAIQPKASSDGQDIVTFWLYKSGLVFTFAGMSTYGSARTPIADAATAANMKEFQPVRWDNIAEFHVDSMPSQVARFRGGKDSVDVLIATLPPYAAIAEASDVKPIVEGTFWLLQNGQVLVYHDSSTIAGPGVRAWTRRVAPGDYVYRAEASAAASLRAARTTATVQTGTDPRTGFSPSGFGMSDVLLVTHVEMGPPGARWSALHAEPLVGSIAHDGELSVVWENYDFGQKDAAAQYSVALAIMPNRSGAGRIAARILGALADVAQIDRQSDRIIVHFDRSVPYSAAFADQVQIGLGDTPAGSYTLTLEITDKISGKKVSRATTLFIRP